MRHPRTSMMLALLGVVALALLCAAAPSAVAGASLRSSRLTRSFMTLSNSQLSLSWEPATHALVSLRNTVSSGVATEMLLPVDLGNRAVVEQQAQWWSGWVVSEGFEGAQLVTPTVTAEKKVSLSQGDGVTNMTFAYSFTFAATAASADATVSLSVQVVASLADTSSDVLYTFYAQKGAGSMGVGFENITLVLPGLNPTAAGAGVSDAIVLPSGYGVETSPFAAQGTKTHNMAYPDSAAAFQALLYYHNVTDKDSGLQRGPGVSVQARDQVGTNKFFVAKAMPQPGASAQAQVQMQVQLGMLVFPVNVGLDLGEQVDAATGQVIPFPLCWSLFAGDAFDGVRSYATWARAEAEWTQGGSILSRPDTPDWLVQTNLWLNSGWQQVDIFNETEGDPAVVVERLKTILPLLNLPSPVGFHWYEFQLHLFDTGYPDYTPKPGFAEAIADLHEAFPATLKIAPYINGRIFDTGISKWTADDAQKWAAKQAPSGWGPSHSANLSLYEESYGSGATFSVMCPATDYWARTLEDVAASLKKLDVDALYVDQIGAATTRACFDGDTHGHTRGDGRSWVTGNNSVLSRIGAAMAGSTGNGSVILTESNGESIMRHVHVYLTLSATSYNASGSVSRMVPLFPAIYGGLFTSMGSEFFQSDLLPTPDVFAAKLAWQFHAGITLGWMSLGGTSTAPPMGMFDLLTSQRADGSLVYGEELEWIRALDAFRSQAASTYLVGGRRSRELPFEYTADVAPHRGRPTTFAHPHRNDLRTAKTHVKRATVQGHSHEHEHDAHGVDESQLEAAPVDFTYSPVTASVWSSADGSSLGVLLSCSSSPAQGGAPSYTVVVPQMSVVAFGAAPGSEAQPWTLRQWSRGGGLIGLQKFASGERIAIKTVVPCRGVQWFTLAPTTTNGGAKAEPRVALA